MASWRCLCQPHYQFHISTNLLINAFWVISVSSYLSVEHAWTTRDDRRLTCCNASYVSCRRRNHKNKTPPFPVADNQKISLHKTMIQTANTIGDKVRRPEDAHHRSKAWERRLQIKTVTATDVVTPKANASDGENVWWTCSLAQLTLSISRLEDRRKYESHQENIIDWFSIERWQASIYCCMWSCRLSKMCAFTVTAWHTQREQYGILQASEWAWLPYCSAYISCCHSDPWWLVAGQRACVQSQRTSRRCFPCYVRIRQRHYIVARSLARLVRHAAPMFDCMCGVTDKNEVLSSRVKLTRRLTFDLTLGQQKRVPRALNSRSNAS